MEEKGGQFAAHPLYTPSRAALCVEDSLHSYRRGRGQDSSNDTVVYFLWSLDSATEPQTARLQVK
jgi:hypothetical protein